MTRELRLFQSFKRVGGFLLAFAGVAVLAITAACGGSGNAAGGGGGGGNPPPATSATQVRIGDAPADRVISLEVTVGPITLTPSTGSAVTALAGTRRVELTHLSGASEPLALLNVPQGTYASASITVSNPEVVFVNSAGVVTKLQPAFNQAVAVNFSPVLSITSAASVFNLDVNVANALTFDAQGNVTGFNASGASFNVQAAAVAAENQQEAEDGELEDTTGTVTNVSGSSFTLSLGQNGASLTFTTDANTQFSDGAALATLLNTLVTVEGVTKSDGTLYAKEVEGIENNSGMEAEGLITQVTGNPATQLSVLTQDGSGSGVSSTTVGSALAVDVTGVQYKVSKGNIDTSGIGGLPSSPNFPFDATTVHAGQRVEVESASSLSGSSLVAEKVKLQQQTLSGTISALSGSAAPSTFTLTVPADSAFAQLAGSSTIKVFWQPGTNVRNLPSGFRNGDSVRVRGLLFFTGSAFNMIARRVSQ